MPQRFAVTGATGFIGRRLVRYLADRGADVTALTRRPQPEQARVRWIPGDLDDADALARLVGNADAVIHAAGLVKARNRAEFEAVNVAGAENLLAALTAQGAGQRLVLVSSMAAREPQLSDYAATKRAAEDAVRTRTGLSWSILRPPAVYGPGDLEILKLFRAIRRGVAPVPGNGEGRFSVVYVDDLVRAVAMTAGHAEAGGKTLEVDDGTAGGYSHHDLAGLAAGLLGRRVRGVPAPSLLLKAVAAANSGIAGLLGRPAMLSPGKARELLHPDWVAGPDTVNRVLGFRAETGLEAGLGRTFAWYRDQGLL